MPDQDPRQARTYPWRLASLVAFAVAMWLAPAEAQQPQPGAAATAGNPTSGQKDVGASAPPWAGDLSTRSNLLGDLGGLRPILDRYGVSFGLTETTEVLGNVSGGTRRGAIVEGLTQMSVGIDTKSFGLEGGIFNVSAFQIHGQGLSSKNVPNLNLISSIEARPTTRLNELWFQQSFWDGRADVKIGQQAADLEFITSEYEDLFMNSGFGWPTLPASDLPSGGPAYPLSTPGIRLRVRPTDEITTLLGVFNGSPSGLRPGDPQRTNLSGTNFDVSSGAFVIGEIQYGLNRGKDAAGLPGTYKLGAWYNTNRFADGFYQSGDTAQQPGVLVGIPRSKRGDWSVYAALDQLVYRPDPDADGGLALTARLMGAPTDRNLVDVFVQGGIVYKGPFGRPNDSVGVGAEWLRVGARARAGDRAAELLPDAAPIVVRSSETVFEATYQTQIRPWWVVQADFQYVFNPGAGAIDPVSSSRRLGDAAVFGLRSVVKF